MPSSKLKVAPGQKRLGTTGRAYYYYTMLNVGYNLYHPNVSECRPYL